MKFTAAIFSALLTPAAVADVVPFSYHLGNVSVTENETRIAIQTTPPITVAILPGGKTWPILSLSDTGSIYVGNTIIHAASGTLAVHAHASLALPHDVDIDVADNGFRFEQDGKKCFLSLQ